MLKLMYITNDISEVDFIEKSGIDRIFVDLEINGKKERQGHLDTHISNHVVTDVEKIKKVQKNSKLLVRVNPIFEGSKDEINKCIKMGADIIMLPMFKTASEVLKFIEIVDGRVTTCLLLETTQAVARIDEILSVAGIDEIHIGLNDLHLGFGLDFMFEILSGGIVEYLVDKIKEKGIPYGFGGIAKLGHGDIPAEMILAEHYRLGSSMVILSRTFRNNSRQENEKSRIEEIIKIREFENHLKNQEKEYFEYARKNFKLEVNRYVERNRRK